MQAGEAAMIDASVPAIAASQLRMEGEISGLVQGEQAASQTLVEVDKELEWLASALGCPDARTGLQTAMQRLVNQVAQLEGRGGTTTLEYGQDNELNTVATLQSRMESDVSVLTPTQNSLAEVVFEVYQELARINGRLGKQDGQPGQVVPQEPGQVLVQAPAAPQVVQYHSVGQSQVRSVSWAPGAALLQQAPTPAPAVAVPQPNLPTYGPPTTVVAPAQYMMPMTGPAASASVAVEQAVPTQQISFPQEPIGAQTAPVAYSAPAAAPAPQPVATQAAQLPALAPTTVVAAAQYMMPGSVTAVPAAVPATMPAEASAAVSIPSVAQSFAQPPLSVARVAQPVPMEPTAMVQAPAVQTLPALAPTTVVAPAQYMAPGTASVGVPVGTTNAPIPVATGSLAAPSATMGQFISMPPGVSSTVTVPGSAQTGSMVLNNAGVLPMRGSLLKAGSITDDVFNMVDKDNDGVISRSEFRGALKGNVISATASTRLALQGHM